MKKRVDQVLVELGLVPSRTKAADLIKARKVLYHDEPVNKASMLVTGEGENLKINEDFFYVSRGAGKLQSAHQSLNLSFKDKIIADVGASTGGFTDYVLQNGASKVYAIDVGHDQLDQKLRQDSRVINLEGTNIRDLKDLPEKVDMIVSDLSFISLGLVLDSMLALCQQGAELVLLFKPQFEVGREHIGKNGIVKNLARVEECLQDFLTMCRSKRLIVVDYIASQVKGRTGNQEYLVYLKVGQ